jgi:hypothetical protein
MGKTVRQQTPQVAFRLLVVQQAFALKSVEGKKQASLRPCPRASPAIGKGKTVGGAGASEMADVETRDFRVPNQNEIHPSAPFRGKKTQHARREGAQFARMQGKRRSVRGKEKPDPGSHGSLPSAFRADYF